MASKVSPQITLQPIDAPWEDEEEWVDDEEWETSNCASEQRNELEYDLACIIQAFSRLALFTEVYCPEHFKELYISLSEKAKKKLKSPTFKICFDFINSVYGEVDRTLCEDLFEIRSDLGQTFYEENPEKSEQDEVTEAWWMSVILNRMVRDE